MRHLEFADQAVERARLLERVQVLALDVLDQRHRDRGVVRHAADDRRDLVQAGHLRGSPATLAGDDLVARRFAGVPSGQRSHDDRLHDALRANRIGELLQALRAHVDAGLVAAALQQVDGQVRELVVARRGGARLAGVAICIQQRRRAEQGFEDPDRDWGFVGMLAVPQERADSSDPGSLTATRPAVGGARPNGTSGSAGGGSSFLAPDHLARQREVGERAARVLVVVEHGLAEARRLGEPHVARDDGVETPCRRSASRSCAETSFDRLFRGSNIVRRMPSSSSAGFTLPGSARRCSAAREALERVVLALHRHRARVGRDERIEREQVERRRTVDQDDVVELTHRLQRVPQPHFAADLREELNLGGDQVLVGRQQREAAWVDRQSAASASASPSSTSVIE